MCPCQIHGSLYINKMYHYVVVTLHIQIYDYPIMHLRSHWTAATKFKTKGLTHNCTSFVVQVPLTPHRAQVRYLKAHQALYFGKPKGMHPPGSSPDNVVYFAAMVTFCSEIALFTSHFKTGSTMHLGVPAT